MSFQTPITIAEAIRNIEQNRYLLPSIQREFRWKHEKIEWLFDSITKLKKTVTRRKNFRIVTLNSTAKIFEVVVDSKCRKQL
jgi:hypothetical protein